MNYKNARERLKLLLACNFYSADYFVTFTFSDENTKHTRNEVKKELRKYFGLMREEYAKLGVILKYIYTIEGNGSTERLHAHAVISATGNGIDKDTEIIKANWESGFSNLNTLKKYCYDDFNAVDFEEIATYMTKGKTTENMPNGAQMYTPSKTIKTPEETITGVDDCVTLTPPKGVKVITQEEKSTEFGTYKYLEYVYPETEETRSRLQAERNINKAKQQRKKKKKKK